MTVWVVLLVAVVLLIGAHLVGLHVRTRRTRRRNDQ